MGNKELKDNFINERTGIEYIRKGDYYMPNIKLAESKRTGNVGKYGRLRANYLKEKYRAEYILMKVNNELISHLLDIDDICRERIENLITEMVQQENVDEELKANNQMEWVCRMNNIKNRAEEIVIKEVVYEEV